MNKFKQAKQVQKAKPPVDSYLPSARQLAQIHPDELGITFLQRKLGIGYSYAKQLMDKLEDEK